MNLRMDSAVASAYKSRSQIARVVSEAWGAHNLYCASCPRRRLSQERANTRAFDFSCVACGARYQLKSSVKWNERRIVDAGYDAMRQAITSGRAPHLLILQYTERWSVHNLMLVPSFFFSLSTLEKRKPLAPGTRRTGWVGCNILLEGIPPEGRLRMVSAGIAARARDVRDLFKKITPIAKLRFEVRGWVLDVLKCARSLDQKEFTLEQVYHFERDLKRLHPGNRHIKPKIRQQLQVLRDLGLLRFLGRGRYCFET